MNPEQILKSKVGRNADVCRLTQKQRSYLHIIHENIFNFQKDKVNRNLGQSS